MKKLKLLLLFLSISVFCSSCSLLLPYEEEPLCRKGKEGGYCGSLLDVYEETLNMRPTREKPVKLKPGKPCLNCSADSYDRK